MTLKVLSGVFAVVLASGAAFGQSAGPGDAQLAASAGVAPGIYTNAQLVQIIEARRDGDKTQLAFVLSQANAVATRADFTADVPSFASDGLTQIELIQLQDARREGDRALENFILSGANRESAPPPNVVTPGKAQMAALLGVDPADYTLQQLVAMDHVTNF